MRTIKAAMMPHILKKNTLGINATYIVCGNHFDINLGFDIEPNNVKICCIQTKISHKDPLPPWFVNLNG